MATQILSVADTGAASSDVTIAAGDTLTVSLKTTAGSPPPANARVIIKIKDDNSVYHAIEDELNAQTPSLVIAGSGTFQFYRCPGASVGVFSA